VRLVCGNGSGYDYLDKNPQDIVHVLFVAVPFLASSVSALLFWRSLFGSWWLALPAVLVVDVLALMGLILSIARVPSPFQPLRHALPFVSIVPLGRELYVLLEHNGPAIAVTVTILAIVVLTAIAWKCFNTIEALFIDPVDAARESAREHMNKLRTELAQLHEMNLIVDGFMMERLRYHSPRVTDTPARQDVPQLPEQTTQPGFVYLLRATNEQYKIGRAKDVAARVRNIAGFVPFEVETVHAIATDDMVRLERHLHFVYESAGKRINGEWFHLLQQDVVAIQAIGASLNSDAFDDALDTLSLIACPPSDTPDTDPITQARLLRQQGISWREVARKVGMSDATLRRKLAQPEEGQL
jgi:hypothetical protein